MPNKRIAWIDGLKFFASLGILLGHFHCAFYNLCEIKPDLNRAIAVGLNGILHFATNGTYLMYIFCVLSGYLASRKKVDSLKELVSVLGIRYLRFVISVC